MGVWVPWLADAARLTGYPVIETPRWRARGHRSMRVVEGVVGHHTANPQAGDYPSLRIVRDGRSDLRGPLAQFGLGRSGSIYVIAAGESWHAGASNWAGFTDLGDEFLGIEAESVGTRDDWTPEQRDCYPRLVAALLYYMRRGSDRFGFHKEVCRPRGRKIDAAYWDGNQMRERVAWLLATPLTRIPREDDDDMAQVPQEEWVKVRDWVAVMYGAYGPSDRYLARRVDAGYVDTQVWDHPLTNWSGEEVAVKHIVVALEARLGKLEEKIDKLLTALPPEK